MILVPCPVNISPLPDSAIEAMPIADAGETFQDYIARGGTSPLGLGPCFFLGMAASQCAGGQWHSPQES